VRQVLPEGPQPEEEGTRPVRAVQGQAHLFPVNQSLHVRHQNLAEHLPFEYSFGCQE
jgi:hypothetical protein